MWKKLRHAVPLLFAQRNPTIYITWSKKRSHWRKASFINHQTHCSAQERDSISATKKQNDTKNAQSCSISTKNKHPTHLTRQNPTATGGASLHSRRKRSIKLSGATLLKAPIIPNKLSSYRVLPGSPKIARHAASGSPARQLMSGALHSFKCNTCSWKVHINRIKHGVWWCSNYIISCSNGEASVGWLNVDLLSLNNRH